MSEQLPVLVTDARVPHPIHLVITDDLDRNRLTVFFRLLLAIPHFIWLSLWGIAAWFAIVAAWFVGIFTGRVPDGLHGFARMVRDLARTSAGVSFEDRGERELKGVSEPVRVYAVRES